MMCHVDQENNVFCYLSTIIAALEEFYRNDYELLSTGRLTHEQTISFRVGMYLAKRLESPSNHLYVDCEYHGDVYNPELRKIVNGENIRPDIIYHDRGWQNEFCIEMKVRSLVPKDYAKLNGLISEYGYHEGYGICNIGRRYVTIIVISSEHLGRGIRYRLRYNHCTQRLELPDGLRRE